MTAKITPSKRPAAALVALLLLLTAVFISLSGCGANSVAEGLPTAAPTAELPALIITPVETETDVPPDPTDTPEPEEPTAEPDNGGEIASGPTMTPTRLLSTPAGASTPVPPTETPTVTPTSVPLSAPVLPTLIWTSGGVVITMSETITRFLPLPTAVPTFAVPAGTTNILLLGVDQPLGGNPRTDAIIIVSIDRNNRTAAMLSLPRDMVAYQPNRVINKLNTATRNGGIDLLKQTILYNFGVPIHYYAQIDFDGFKQAIDIIGGIDIAVSCQLTDWRLIEPDMDIHDEDSYHRFTLPVGMHQMDGDLALWYARSRVTTSDFYRQRRQQQLLRGILDTGLSLNLLPQVPTLYNNFHQIVETDMDIGRILQLATIASAVRENGIQHLSLHGRGEGLSAQPYGSFILPIWRDDPDAATPSGRAMAEVFEQLFRPPVLNRATRAPLFVEIINATGNPDMAALAADNLAWHGFVPIISADTPSETIANTQIELFADNDKGAFPWRLTWIFGRRPGHIQLVPNTPYDYNYRVTIGEDYNPCLDSFRPPSG